MIRGHGLRFEERPYTTGRHQEEREMALSDFKSGRKPILIATSVAARGLDIKGRFNILDYFSSLSS